jgi:carbamoyltransferase
MFVLGLSGGLDAVHEQKLDTPENYTYDGAAVLVKDGVVVAAVEEERLDRIKHSNKFPAKAIEFCLGQEGLHLQDLDAIAYYVDESTADALLQRMYLMDPAMSRRIQARTLLRMALGREFGCDVNPEKLRFYEHKLTHAASAMHHSGFDESLVFVIDNAGGLYRGFRDKTGNVIFETLAATSPAKSPQKLCHALLPFLGLGMFDEYKALALAPYGDSDRYATLMGELYQLLPNGDYQLQLGRAMSFLGVVEPRRKDAEFSAEHKDLAAALQNALETIALHVLTHYRETTGLKNLCMAGGMCENTGVNGRVLYSGLFDHVFVHPAAYDSGCAVGAALLASQDLGSPSPASRLRDVFWGAEVGDDRTVEAELKSWNSYLTIDRPADVLTHVAQLLDEGKLVGWIQGPAEFGSHALGNRNVFADPRKAENTSRIHHALSRGEVYRPLAVLVLEEQARDWCDLPAGTDSLPFQNIAARVRDDKRALLAGAVQPDGCARIQTVSRESNPRVWDLISAFGQRTDVAALLTASFNNSFEPAVESVADGVGCFLTSELDYLVIGDFVATRLAASLEDLYLSLPAYVQITRARGLNERKAGIPYDELRSTYTPGFSKRISPALGEALINLDGATPVRMYLQHASRDAESEKPLMNELLDLWAKRMITLSPANGRES